MCYRLGPWVFVGLLAMGSVAGGLFRADSAQPGDSTLRLASVSQTSFNGDRTTDERDLLLLLENWHKAGAILEFLRRAHAVEVVAR